MGYSMNSKSQSDQENLAGYLSNYTLILVVKFTTKVYGSCKSSGQETQVEKKRTFSFVFVLSATKAHSNPNAYIFCRIESKRSGEAGGY